MSEQQQPEITRDYKALGKRVGPREVPRVAAEFERLAEAGGGSLTTEAVVEAARAESSTLHRYFEWDDSHAAELYRLRQARDLIRTIHVKVVYRGQDEAPRWARKYNFVSRDAGVDAPPLAEKLYMPIETVTTRERYLAQVIDNLEKQLAGLFEQYRTYRSFREFQRFGPVFTAIEQALKDAKDERRAVAAD